MEDDDDEFGDLYTDVLCPFSSSLSSTPQSHQPSGAPPPLLPRPIDLNIKTEDDDDNEILYRASHDNPSAPSARVLGGEDNSSKSPIKDSIKSELVNLDKDKDVNFDVEEGNTGILEDSSPVIPGFMENDPGRNEPADVSGGGGWEEEEEEESDSEDDLQIVLNDNVNHHGGTMGIEREIGDDDEDGDPLVIVADGDGPNQAMEEQDWGGDEDGVAAAGGGTEGERKEGGGEVAGKGNANAIVGPKLGYSNNGYHHHPFHSQFKYVRPGLAPNPGATTVGPGATPGPVRPPTIMGPVAGRGRGDWRPPGIKGAPQKNFHQGFGVSVWGAGRGFGGGLEFTLPSHKTIFDVDIDGFEEKPWKYPGVDMSDYFNFGLNEESWKDYCKQLEQHRLETTMQSRIRVYESGRAEQEYDPDLPPELAAATGAHDVRVGNSNPVKLDVGQNDLTKGSARLRPPLPTGRAIQVETGGGERIPSIENRPPRMRDSDAVIEIMCQDTVDDSSTANGTQDGANNDAPTDAFRGSQEAEDDVTQMETECHDDYPQAYNGRKGVRRTPYMNFVHNNMPEGDRISPFHPEAPATFRTDPRGQPPLERRMQGSSPDKSPHLTPNQSTQDKQFLDNMKEESIESIDGKRSPQLSSPITVRDARDLSIEDKDDVEFVGGEGSSRTERDEITENEEPTNYTPKDGNVHHSTKKQKISPHVSQPALQQLDDEDSKAARSSENSKARSGSSKDYQKWQEGVEEEVVQDGGSTRSGSSRRHLDENDFRRKDRNVRQEMERNRIVIRGREDSYPRRDFDANLSHHSHMKHEVYDRRKERENPDTAWQQREEDPHSRKHRTDDRKSERGDEIGSRHRSKMRDIDRSDKDEHVHSRKQLENGSYRIDHDKDGSSRHREREDSVKNRYEMVDDYHIKRRKDEEYLKREYADKEEVLHGHRETTSRRRRERDDQQRMRDNLDDYHSVKHKDEVWLQRERGERHREREELYRIKQSHEENLSKREREEGRGSARSVRSVDDAAWIGHSRAKDEYKGSDKDYQLKHAVRNTEHQKRRGRVEDESLPLHRGRNDVHARGNQFSREDRRSRQERSSSRVDRAVDSYDNQRVHEKKHKENARKNKETEGGDYGILGPSRRNQEDQSGHNDEMVLKRSSEPGTVENEILMQRNSSKRHKEDASSDDEQQDSRRGRTKLERWTSHKERDFSISSKSSVALKFKENDKNNNGSASLEVSKVSDEPPKKVEAVEKHPMGDEKMVGDLENKDTDTKPLEDRHLDTVEKLKKRSERFKLPMPSEKDSQGIKKIETEAVPSVKTETPAESEIKPERPARKRKWISN